MDTVEYVHDIGSPREQNGHVSPNGYVNEACETEVKLELTEHRIANGDPANSLDRPASASANDTDSLVKKVYFDDRGITFHIAQLIKQAGHFATLLKYEIEVQHGAYHWRILREFQQIHALYMTLSFHYMSFNCLKPQITDGGSLSAAPRLPFPEFPGKWRSQMTAEEETKHIKDMELFLTSVFADHASREHFAARRFLEVTWMSFNDPGEETEKFREAFVLKLSCFVKGVLHIECKHDNISCKALSVWKNRWMVLHETCYVYMHMESPTVAGVFLYDQHMELEHLQTRPLAILVKHAIKDLVLKMPSQLEKASFVASFSRQLEQCVFTKDQPHGSFSPVREQSRVKWLVNGEDYMSTVADALETAQEEIYIGGWWVSPDVHLKRPGRVDKYWRLDHVLKRKAEAGVMIHILMYKESPIALGINSLYSKKKLKHLHPNIMVKRHPDKNVLLWSHHEKIVVVDQKIAFVGGIDLCYGRWDNHLHRLTDTGHKLSTADEIDGAISGHDVNGKNAKRMQQGRSFKAPTLKPDHHRRFRFVEYLYAPFRNMRIMMNTPKFASHSKMRHRAKRLRKRVGKAGRTAYRKVRRNKSKAVHDSENPEHESAYMEEFTWLGKDYCNEVKKAFVQPATGSVYEDILDRWLVPRLPWHDAGTVMVGTVARDVSRHFIQKWNTVKMQKFRFDDEYPFLIPSLYSELQQENDIDIFQSDGEDWCEANIQVLRNTASWSSGLLPDHVEKSIQQGYCDLIDISKHFVYLESQFFITLVNNDKVVKNKVGDAIFRRIEKAFRNRETWRLYIVLPLQPAIAGSFGTRAGAALQAVTHWIYQSISRGGSSLFERLLAVGIHPSDYITISGLRTHGIIEDKLVTEIVYVHSKLMVVDDIYTIIGSANMNDRSMLGARDSEIAILVTDTKFEDSLMDGQPYQSGVFSGGLRRHLMKIGLGLMEDMLYGVSPEKADDIVRDPISDDFYRETWIKTAVENDAIFSEVFNCLPSDEVLSFGEVDEYCKRETIATKSPLDAHRLLQNVHGYVVKFPLKFLMNSNLLPSFTTSPGLLPVINWT